jgi:hypothetical protein
MEAAVSTVTGPRTPTPSAYDETLRIMSEASVTQRFEAFRDIAWDDPAFAVDPDDERWILPETDVIAHHPWYTALPRERQIAVGRHRLIAMTKTGSQFEQLLLLGGTQFLMRTRNSNPEFRYFMHELTEECHHIQMFQEVTNRACPEVSGVARWLLRAFPLVGHLGGIAPAMFFAIILAGEEPIDYVQKETLRSGGMHPLLDRIMAIHAAEEARHIGFAHAWLEHHVPHLSRFQRLLVGLLTPVAMRIGSDAIVKPSRRDRKMMGMPRYVVRDSFERGPRAAKFRRDQFADVRMVFDRLGLRTRSTLWVWRRLGIDGRPARFRAEPRAAAH